MSRVRGNDWVVLNSLRTVGWKTIPEIVSLVRSSMGLGEGTRTAGVPTLVKASLDHLLSQSYVEQSVRGTVVLYRITPSGESIATNQKRDV